MADTPSHTHAVVLKMTSAWVKYNDTQKVWSWKFSLSGADVDTPADAEAIIVALWDLMGGFTGGDTYMSSALYYKAGQLVNSYAFEFDSSQYPGSDSNWTSSGGGNFQQLEVCAMIRAHMGNNTKGRPYYLRKYLHSIPATNSGGALVPEQLSSYGQAALEGLSSGFGASDYTVVDPKTGNAPESAWQLVPYLTTRQLRKSPKAKG